MSLDGLAINKIIQNLQILVTGKVNHVYQPVAHEVVIEVRANRENHDLLVNLDSNFTRIQITNQKYVKPISPNPFTMLLRKHLEGGIIKSIEQIELDRIVKIEIEKRDELYDIKTKKIYIELFPRSANLIICDQDEIIIDVLKKQPFSIDNQRIMLPRAKYDLNQNSKHQINPLISEINELDEVSNIMGASQQTLQTLTNAFENELDFNKYFMENLNDNSLYICKKKNLDCKLCTFNPYFSNDQEVIKMDVFKAMDYYYQNDNNKVRIQQQSLNLEKQVKRIVKKYMKKLNNFQKDYDSYLDNEQDKKNGELLFMHQYQHTDNTNLTVANVYDYDLERNVEIRLDPRLSIKDNARYYMKKYNKAKSGINHLEKLIKETKYDLEYLNDIIGRFEYIDFEEVKEIEKELVQNKFLIQKKKITDKKKPKKNKITILEYIDEYETRYLIGKNNIQNQYLTFQYSRKNDLWFHTKQGSGAHIVVKDGKLDETTIRTAANLAVLYSNNKLSSSVEVNYCYVNQLRKGQYSGQAILSSYKSIFIDPNEDLIDKTKLKKINI